MRITDGTRFPHPVLNPYTSDFTSGEFDITFSIEEKPATGALAVNHQVTLSEPSIRALVEKGRASIGCFVRCGDTYYTELRELSWPAGVSDFPAGALLNRVTIRPLVWLKDELVEWNPGTIHPEFEPPVSLMHGDIVAVGPEYVISVGQAKFAPLESIFELSAAEHVPPGRITINPDSDRITILVAPELFGTINLLRGQRSGLAILMNGVYLPAVIELLDQLRTDGAQYSGRRWFQPFMAKCDARGIDPTAKSSLLDSAQRLLGDPASTLSLLASEADQ